MVINGMALLEAAPIVDMLHYKDSSGLISHGLTEAGYDIRIKQDVVFSPEGYQGSPHQPYLRVREPGAPGWYETPGRFTLASAMEEFQMPGDLVGVVHDKSSWARRGLSVFNTVIEPGWYGFLTLELVFHGQVPLEIPAGSGIAQVLFRRTAEPAFYAGKYQNQEDRPIPAR